MTALHIDQDAGADLVGLPGVLVFVIDHHDPPVKLRVVGERGFPGDLFDGRARHFGLGHLSAPDPMAPDDTGREP